jgi:hypothetical protein
MVDGDNHVGLLRETLADAPSFGEGSIVTGGSAAPLLMERNRHYRLHGRGKRHGFEP